MMEKHIKVGVGVMIIHDNQILMGHRNAHYEDTGGIYQPDCWCLPGGLMKQYMNVQKEKSKKKQIFILMIYILLMLLMISKKINIL